MMPQEKISVGIVIGGINFKFGTLCTTFCIDNFGLPFLLREKRGDR